MYTLTLPAAADAEADEDGESEMELELDGLSEEELLADGERDALDEGDGEALGLPIVPKEAKTAVVLTAALRSASIACPDIAEGVFLKAPV
jgi:hypothetical protein